MSVEPRRLRPVNITTSDADLNRIAFENDLRPDGVVFVHTGDS